MKVVIDGNIGSGKTTQLDLLEKIGCTVRREAIDDWPLDEFYKDPSRWAFLLHVSILLSNQPRGSGLEFIERSLMSSRWVFWDVLKKDGNITPNEDKIYSKLFNEHSWYPDVFIYLKKSPEKCYEHIQKRTQPGDKAITLQYLKDLDSEYMKLVEGIPGCEVLVVNAERPAEEIHEEIYKYLVGNELLSTHSERGKM